MSYPRHNVHPVNAGWTYKGSNAQSRVDFYEKDGCRMDYYPTTGIARVLHLQHLQRSLSWRPLWPFSLYAAEF